MLQIISYLIFGHYTCILKMKLKRLKEDRNANKNRDYRVTGVMSSNRPYHVWRVIFLLTNTIRYIIIISNKVFIHL